MSILKWIIKIPAYTVMAFVLLACIPIWIVLWFLFMIVEVTDSI